MIHSEHWTLDAVFISWWIICGTFLQMHCFSQQWNLLCQVKHPNSVTHDFIFSSSVYVFLIVFLPYAFSECVLRQMGTFPFKYVFPPQRLVLFCFVCLRAAKETSCIWAQSNNKTTVLLDVAALKNMMLLHVFDIWNLSLENAILNS